LVGIFAGILPKLCWDSAFNLPAVFCNFSGILLVFYKQFVFILIAIFVRIFEDICDGILPGIFAAFLEAFGQADCRHFRQYVVVLLAFEVAFLLKIWLPLCSDSVGKHFVGNLLAFWWHFAGMLLELFLAF
jgi:hypothetical protein